MVCIKVDFESRVLVLHKPLLRELSDLLNLLYDFNHAPLGVFDLIKLHLDGSRCHCSSQGEVDLSEDLHGLVVLHIVVGVFLPFENSWNFGSDTFESCDSLSCNAQFFLQFCEVIILIFDHCLHLPSVDLQCFHVIRGVVKAFGQVGAEVDEHAVLNASVLVQHVLKVLDFELNPVLLRSEDRALLSDLNNLFLEASDMIRHHRLTLTRLFDVFGHVFVHCVEFELELCDEILDLGLSILLVLYCFHLLVI